MRSIAVVLTLRPRALRRLRTIPPITVNVDAAANRHAIDPRIYGVAWATAAQITTLGLTLNRWGGNAMSRYNWAFSTANRCKDYYFFNIPDAVSSGDGSNGKSADDFIDLTRDAGAEPVMTIPMLSLLAGGPHASAARFPQPRIRARRRTRIRPGSRSSAATGAWQDGNGIDRRRPAHPRRARSEQHQHVLSALASGRLGAAHDRHLGLGGRGRRCATTRSTTSRSLWSFDHWDVHPDGTTYDEVWGKMEELGAIIRAKDPDAVITGGEEWGWSGYFMSGLDHGERQTRRATAPRTATSPTRLAPAAVRGVRGRRTACAFSTCSTAHFYPQSGEFWSGDTSTEMQDLRNRSTRSLWDPDYVDESWIGGTESTAEASASSRASRSGSPTTIPARRSASPNTTGATSTTSTAPRPRPTSSASSAAKAWTWPSAGTTPGDRLVRGQRVPMYRNYDGARREVRRHRASARPRRIRTRSRRSPASARRDGALTIMLIAKVLDRQHARDGEPRRTSRRARRIERWQLDVDERHHAARRSRAVGSSIALTLPAQSITLLVVPAADLPDPPALTATAIEHVAGRAARGRAVTGAVSYDVQRSFNDSAFAPLVTVGTTVAQRHGARGEHLLSLSRPCERPRGIDGLQRHRRRNDDVFTDSPLIAGTSVKARALHAVANRRQRDARRRGSCRRRASPIRSRRPLRSRRFT